MVSRWYAWHSDTTLLPAHFVAGTADHGGRRNNYEYALLIFVHQPLTQIALWF